ncbi:hypothetical protein DICVIV_11251 [Dictyocaulus viviparus]|uniref:Uncharacterized protein n=1 Tax=Dictyocaulus viviparus TaxID=29172 RepID=A0A0D8XDQ9_DICVI|nr:hypothetical protein DICVIV_11251 [Dictyocaulus viviparus]
MEGGLGKPGGGPKPIWPRVLQSVQSEAELFLDDDNFAYRVSPYRDAASLIRRMDKQENYDKVMNFLEKYIRE